MTKDISGFSGEYRWLSNFWSSEIEIEGWEYPTAEHAYQAAKSEHIVYRNQIANALTPGAQKLHTRNVGQILGKDLNTPSYFVLCWTPQGQRGGGTGQALRVADGYNVAVFDLGFSDRQRMLLKLKEHLEDIDKLDELSKSNKTLNQEKE